MCSLTGYNQYLHKIKTKISQETSNTNPGKSNIVDDYFFVTLFEASVNFEVISENFFICSGVNLSLTISN